jgi:hypothetical protein
MSRRVAALSLVAVLMLGGCGDSGKPTGEGPGPSGSGEPGKSARGSDDPLPGGLVTVTNSQTSGGGDLVNVMEIPSGTVIRSVALPPDPQSRPVGRDRFDADRRRLTYVLNCATLHVATIKQDRFESVATWTVPQDKESRGQCFSSPRFQKDGRIRATLASGSQRGRFVTVDPAQPGSEMRDEGPNPEPDPRKDYTVPGQPKTEARVFIVGGAPARVLLSGSATDGVFDYTCETRVDDVSFACLASTQKKGQQYGSVALAKVDPAAKTITVTEVSPPAATNGLKLFVAPDGKRVVVADTREPEYTYVTSLSGGTPEKLATPAVGEVIFWG